MTTYPIIERTLSDHPLAVKVLRKIADTVARKLGVSPDAVQIVGQIYHKPRQMPAPLFQVPSHVADRARSLGLYVE